MSSARSFRNLRRRQRGFTLVELTVSLVAGLVVAVAVVGLSREATNTFHEEARAAGAAAATRAGSDRLRADLQRASYMSTGNIRFDPMIAHDLNDPNGNVPSIAPWGIQSLVGVRYMWQGSFWINFAGTFPVQGLLQTPASIPDAIDISGNMTTTDQYYSQQVGAAGTSACGGQRITLETDSPAMWRIAGAAGGGIGGPGLDTTLADKIMKQIFQPVTGQTFIVRVVDETGYSQFVRTCAGDGALYAGPGGPHVDIAADTPILFAAAGRLGGVTGFGRVAVNPVHTVRYMIERNTAASYAALNPGADTTKYDLTRRYVNAFWNPVGNPEIVAEYATDLSFGFTVDDGPFPNPLVPAPPAAQPNWVMGQAPVIRNYGFGDVTNWSWGGYLAPWAASSWPGPQRIRSIRSRVSTRNPTADRARTITPPPLAGQNDYQYRYCIKPGGCTVGKTEWARVRTVVSDTQLPNQARMFF